MTSLLSIAVFTTILVLIQIIAALPWLIALLRRSNQSMLVEAHPGMPGVVGWVVVLLSLLKKSSLKWLGLALVGIVVVRVGWAALSNWSRFLRPAIRCGNTWVGSTAPCCTRS